jgi:hypothetical protein
MNRYRIRLDITADQYLGYYRGAIRHVLARCVDGRSIQFPASLLQRVVALDGIHGDFVLVCDSDNKCLELLKA